MALPENQNDIQTPYFDLSVLCMIFQQEKSTV